MKIVLRRNLEYSRLLSFGKENNLLPDKICAFLLAVTPLLQFFNGIVEDAGITIFVLMFPWIILRLVNKLIRSKAPKMSEIGIVAGLIIFFMYRTFIHGFNITNLIYNLVMVGYFIAAATGCINIKHYIRASAGIASLACVLIILQYFCFYILGFHLQLVPTSLLLPEAEQWVLGAKTGLAGITGQIGDLYRPSAFFLEPSHMFLYIFPHIFIVLFSPDINKKRIKMAVLFSVGLLFTTSGMGIVTLACAWGVHFALTSGKANRLHLKNLLKAKNFTILLVLLISAVVLFATVPFVRDSVMRFLDRSNRGAIAGRTRLANDLISKLRGSKLLFGVTNTLEGIDFNMSGFAATMYKFGIVGVVLSYSAYIIGVIKLKKHYFWISILIVVVSFFSAQTHGTFYMMYYVFIILEGNNYLKSSKCEEKKTEKINTGLQGNIAANLRKAL